MFSGTAQVSHQVFQSFVSSECLLVRVTVGVRNKAVVCWRQGQWENCGIPWVNCAVLCAKDEWKDSSEACAIASQNCAVYSVFPSGMTSHSKIAKFNWDCIAPLRCKIFRNSYIWWEKCFHFPYSFIWNFPQPKKQAVKCDHKFMQVIHGARYFCSILNKIEFFDPLY